MLNYSFKCVPANQNWERMNLLLTSELKKLLSDWYLTCATLKKFHVKWHTPIGRVSDNSTRVDKISVYDDTTLRAVQRGHLDAILHRVRPEHSSSQVVDGDTLWAVQICWPVTLSLLSENPGSQLAENESEAVERRVKVNSNATWSNDSNGLPPFDAGLADWGRCDFSPVDHFLHAVIGYSNDYLLLRRGQQPTVFEVHFTQTRAVRDRNMEQMCFLTLTSRHKSKQTKPHTEREQLGQTSDQLLWKSV